MLCACAAPGEGATPPTDWSRQSTASGGGGMDAMIKAARAEGVLDLAAPMDDAFGFNAAIRAFEARFRVRVATVAAPGDAGQVAQASTLDVFDVGVDTAASHTDLFAPYLVFYWLEIPPALKDGRAYWYGSCGGYIAAAYDPGAVAPIRSLSDLAQPGYTVALGGDPRVSNEALSAVVTASLVSGGSPADLAEGVDFFHGLSRRGALTKGSASVTLGWEYAVRGGSVFMPGRSVLGYQVQAVNRHARHPAAARLWEEFLFSDTGQNLCLAGRGRPARLEAMRGDGVLDTGAAALLPRPPASGVMLTPAQLGSARAYVAAHWGAEVCPATC